MAPRLEELLYPNISSFKLVPEPSKKDEDKTKEEIIEERDFLIKSQKNTSLSYLKEIKNLKNEINKLKNVIVHLSYLSLKEQIKHNHILYEDEDEDDEYERTLYDRDKERDECLNFLKKENEKNQE